MPYKRESVPSKSLTKGFSFLYQATYENRIRLRDSMAEMEQKNMAHFPNAFNKVTSDAGSQYRCGRMGRGSQPPSTPNTPPNPPPNTNTCTKSFLNTCLPPFQLNQYRGTDRLMDQWTNKPTDKASYKVACPQLKTEFKNEKR